ncbi:MAG: VPLPA-CTERM sorting domain-containing protein [Rhodobacteraceae bacterium]|nr:VPLPA-CTERM sorting domain-containing protein [Paracoccaceae bacterium]
MFEQKTLKAAFAAMALTVLGATGASAAAVTFFNGLDAQATVSCTVSCDGLVSTDPSVWGEEATLFNSIDVDGDDPGTGVGLNDENDWVSAADGGAFTGTKDESPDTTFESSAKYVLIKLGNEPSIGLIRNTSGGSQSYTFTNLCEGPDNNCTGGGLSHITEFGMFDVPQIPLPAAGFLLIGALGGLGALRRK